MAIFPDFSRFYIKKYKEKEQLLCRSFSKVELVSKLIFELILVLVILLILLIVFLIILLVIFAVLVVFLVILVFHEKFPPFITFLVLLFCSPRRKTITKFSLQFFQIAIK